MKLLLSLIFLVSCASHRQAEISEPESCVTKIRRYGPNKKEVCVKKTNRLGPNKW